MARSSRGDEELLQQSRFGRLRLRVRAREEEAKMSHEDHAEGSVECHNAMPADVDRNAGLYIGSPKPDDSDPADNDLGVATLKSLEAIDAGLSIGSPKSNGSEIVDDNVSETTSKIEKGSDAGLSIGSPKSDDANVFLVPPPPVLTIVDIARLGSALPPPRIAPSNSASTLKRNDGQPGTIPVA